MILDIPEEKISENIRALDFAVTENRFLMDKREYVLNLLRTASSSCKEYWGV